MQSGINTEVYLRDMLGVLRETFEGSPDNESSIFLDKGIGLFNTLEEIGFEKASSGLAGTSIAAHTAHAKFYVDRLREFMMGREEKVNWDQSWLIEDVTAEEWDILRKGIRESYRELLLTIANIEDWNEEVIGDPIAIIAHTAYHLGSIRYALNAPTPQI